MSGGCAFLAVLAAREFAWLVSIFWWIKGGFEGRGLELGGHDEWLVITFTSN